MTSSPLVKVSAFALLAVSLSACNPLPPTPDEEEAAKEKARPKATPTATPKPGSWIYDNEKNLLNGQGKSGSSGGKATPWINPLDTKAKDSGKKDGKYNNPLDKKSH